MAVLSAVLSDESGSMDGAFNRTYHQLWTVIVSSPTESPLSILLSGTVPLPAASFHTDLAAIAQKPEVTIPDKDDPYLRHVSIDYSTRPPAGDPERQSQNSAESPVLRPPEVRWGHIVKTELFTRNRHDEQPRKIRNGSDIGPATVVGYTTGACAVGTSAGEVPDPAPEREVRYMTLSVSRNETTYEPDYADSFLDTVNSDTFQGFPAGEARCTQFDGVRGYEKGVRYWVVSYGFEFGFHDLDLRDAGSFSIDTSGGSGNYKQIPSVAAGGVALTRVNLNGSGEKLSVEDAPIYLRFRKYFRIPYAPLNLTNL